MTKAIQFYDIDYAALGGIQTVQQPAIVGKLTAHGQNLYAQINDGFRNHITGKQANRVLRSEGRTKWFEDVFRTGPISEELLEHEIEKYGNLTDDAMFRIETDFRTKDKGARTPGWHQDGDTKYTSTTRHIYIFGDADASLNTQYALRVFEISEHLKPFFDALNDSKRVEHESHQHLDQIKATVYFRKMCGIGQIGAYEILCMPDTLWHRSSPLHATRQQPWRFRRASMYRPGG